MARTVVRHVAVREGEAFDLDPHEQVISAEYEHPWMHLIVLWTETAHNDGPGGGSDG